MAFFLKIIGRTFFLILIICLNISLGKAQIPTTTSGISTLANGPLQKNKFQKVLSRVSINASNTNIIEGCTVILTAVPKNTKITLGNNFIWRFNGAVIPAATQATHMATLAGEYTVQVNTTQNSKTRNEKSLTVVLKQTPNYMQVKGKDVMDIAGNKVILRGTNVDVYKTTFSDFFQLAEIEKAGANVVRINWWTEQPGANGPFPYTIANLDAALAECQRLKLVPIVELHDVVGCQDVNHPDFENKVINFWLRSDVIALIKKYQSTFILNVANEVGKAEWVGNVVPFKEKYISVIIRLRTAGISVPIMIDAPDCGTSSHQILGIAQELLNADSKKSLIFSVHTYWQSLDAATIQQRMAAMVASNFCFVLGEVANVQGDNPSGAGNFDLSASGKMDTVLTAAHNNNMGYMWWLWWNDGVKKRQLSSTGLFANLTTQGQKVVVNAPYALIKNKTAYKAKTACN
jgi:mannan endo-1,4-beta-mannosidase